MQAESNSHQDDKISSGVECSCYADSYFLAHTKTDALHRAMASIQWQHKVEKQMQV